jgi:DNA-directed RNA polymerase subunit RPC12/RpoP
MLEKLLGRNKKQSSVICPGCGKDMDVSSANRAIMQDYYEIRRVYSCGNCGKTTAALELISLDGSLPSIFNQLELLQKSTDILHLHLDKLLKSLKQMKNNGSGYYDGPTLN